MSDDEKKSPTAEERRAARKAATAEARAAQREIDMEELDKLEQQHGDGAVAELDMPRLVPGLPTMAIFKAPEPQYFKRCKERQLRAKGDPMAMNSASSELATVCLLYPKPEVYDQMCAAVAGLHDSAGAKVIEMAQAKASAEGK